MLKPVFLMVPFVCSAVVNSQAQYIIHLKNPSFELDQDFRCSQTPKFWENLGQEFDTPPDVQPGCFDVSTAASHGSLYLSMVVRENGSCEKLGQPLEQWLERDSTYAFSITLARSAVFRAMSKTSNMDAYFTQACALQVIGFNEKTKSTEVLAETVPVYHTEWRDYILELKPKKDRYHYLQIKAIHDPESTSPYNGNILVDNLSPIIQINP